MQKPQPRYGQRIPAIELNLLEFDSAASFFDLLLDVFSFVLGRAFLNSSQARHQRQLSLLSGPDQSPREQP